MKLHEVVVQSRDAAEADWLDAAHLIIISLFGGSLDSELLDRKIDMLCTNPDDGVVNESKNKLFTLGREEYHTTLLKLPKEDQRRVLALFMGINRALSFHSAIDCINYLYHDGAIIKADHDIKSPGVSSLFYKAVELDGRSFYHALTSNENQELFNELFPGRLGRDYDKFRRQLYHYVRAQPSHVENTNLIKLFDILVEGTKELMVREIDSRVHEVLAIK